MAGTASVTSSSGNGKATLYPFLFGTQEQRVPIAAIPLTPGLKAATVRIPKNGYLAKMTYRFVGSVTISGAGTATNTITWDAGDGGGLASLLVLLKIHP